ncbi:MAG: Rap1a/Tai family immunity protein [Rhodospirillaceae bacterium]
MIAARYQRLRRAALSTGILAVCLLVAGTGDGFGLSHDCNTEIKMARCCDLYEKSLQGKIPQYDLDLAHQCSNEIIGARDQVDQQKSFNACIPADVSNKYLSKLFRTYVENHREFWDRPARFGMLNVWSLSWPCHK